MVKRANRVKFATAKVFASSPDDPPQAAFPFPAGWGTGRRLQGDAVHAFADPDDVVDTEFAPDPEGGDPGLGRGAPEPGRLRRDQTLHLAGAPAAHPARARRSSTTS